MKYKVDQFLEKLYVYKGYFPFLNNLATDSYGVLSHLKVQSICIKLFKTGSAHQMSTLINNVFCYNKMAF